MIHISHVECFLQDFASVLDKPIEILLTQAREVASKNGGFLQAREVTELLGQIDAGDILARLVMTNKEYIALSCVNMVRQGLAKTR